MIHYIANNLSLTSFASNSNDYGRLATSQEYPEMFYRQDRTKTTGEDETRIVQDAQEQQAAEAQGWRTTPTPKPPSYPQYWG